MLEIDKNPPQFPFFKGGSAFGQNLQLMLRTIISKHITLHTRKGIKALFIGAFITGSVFQYALAADSTSITPVKLDTPELKGYVLEADTNHGGSSCDASIPVRHKCNPGYSPFLTMEPMEGISIDIQQSSTEFTLELYPKRCDKDQPTPYTFRVRACNTKQNVRSTPIHFNWTVFCLPGNTAYLAGDCHT